MNTPSFITLTINPALDVSTDVREVIPAEKLRCGASHYEPGGGGVNVARVLKRLDAHPVAIYTAGGPTGAAFTELLDREQIPTILVPIEGSTRESFTIDETSTGKQFRFVLEGPALTEPEWQATLRALERTIEPGSYVVASGSLPAGVPDDFYARVARIAKRAGAHCIVDASGPALREAVAEGVLLVKPSRTELEEFAGHPLDSRDAQIVAAREIISAGGAELVALSLGAEGALVVSDEQTLFLAAPDVKVRGTVGAGDSFVAGFVLRLAQGATPGEALRTAVAAGAATASCPTTALCTAELVTQLEAGLTPVVL